MRLPRIFSLACLSLLAIAGAQRGPRLQAANLGIENDFLQFADIEENPPDVNPGPATPPQEIPAGPELMPPDLWDDLSPISEEELNRIQDQIEPYVLSRSSLPVAISDAREMASEHASQFIAEAERQKLGALELFTDAHFQNPDRLYFFSQKTMAQLNLDYNLNTLMAISGKDEDDEPFRMLGLFAGRNHVIVIYDRDREFKFEHPTYGQNFTFEPVVIQKILAPSSLKIDGVRIIVKKFVFTIVAEILQITGTPDGMVKIITDKKTAVSPSRKIQKRRQEPDPQPAKADLSRRLK